MMESGPKIKIEVNDESSITNSALGIRPYHATYSEKGVGSGEGRGDSPKEAINNAKNDTHSKNDTVSIIKNSIFGR